MVSCPRANPIILSLTSSQKLNDPLLWFFKDCITNLARENNIRGKPHHRPVLIVLLVAQILITDVRLGDVMKSKPTDFTTGHGIHTIHQYWRKRIGREELWFRGMMYASEAKRPVFKSKLLKNSVF